MGWWMMMMCPKPALLILCVRCLYMQWHGAKHIFRNRQPVSAALVWLWVTWQRTPSWCDQRFYLPGHLLRDFFLVCYSWHALFRRVEQIHCEVVLQKRSKMLMEMSRNCVWGLRALLFILFVGRMIICDVYFNFNAISIRHPLWLGVCLTHSPRDYCAIRSRTSRVHHLQYRVWISQ